jgi:hypothetical protein
MKKSIEMLTLLFLLACQSTLGLEEDARYAKLAIVTDKHVFTDLERKQAHANEGGGSNIGFGLGVGSAGGFGGIMLGMGERHNSSDMPPQVARGAIRYTVRPLSSEQLVEVMSYAQYQVGDCVKVLAGHPTEYSRFFELKAGEHCN